MLKKTFSKIGDWLEDAWDWLEDAWDWIDWNLDVIVPILIALLLVAGIVLAVLGATGFFYDEVENYDFTAVVLDKDHYTTSYVSYIKSGNSTIPITNITHHYTVQWENGDVRDTLEIDQNHYEKVAIGDFINVHCSVKKDKKGELHYYYSFKGY